jgi:two-component system invasion response regulator UvrY
MRKTTLVIVDDHTLVREMWSFILNANPALSVIGEAGNAEEGIELVKSLQPDVVIMDINLPAMNGIEATREIRKLAPESKVLGVSLHTQPSYAKKMMKEGASGYVTKNSSRDEMFGAIEQIRTGGKYICQEIKNILSEQMMNAGEQIKGLDSLSARESGVIALIKEGMSSKEIAEVLAISTKTVEVHRYNILRKLNLKNTASLVNYINQSGIEFGKN